MISRKRYHFVPMTSNPTDDDYVVSSMLHARDQIRALVHVPSFGHAVGRAVWDLVRDTATTFVLRITGYTSTTSDDETEEEEEEEEEETYTCAGSMFTRGCVRLSRLLGSVVGELEPRWQDRDRRLSWVSARVFVGWDREGGDGFSWYLQDACKMYYDGTGFRAIGDDPAGFSTQFHAANGKWFVRCGDRPTSDGSGLEWVMLTQRLNVWNELETGRCEFGGGSVTTVVIPESVARRVSGELRFVPSRPDEMLFAVISPKDSAASFLVVDVESTHTSGTLRILSTTPCLNDEIAQVNGSLNVPIWNCNDRSQTPSRFVKLPTTATAVTGANTLDASHEVTGSHGFLFHVDRAQFRITVIDASTTSTCTTHPPPLVLSFPLWDDLTLSIDFPS
ncbi:hypothetical protein Pelo_6833 [Pelomyxa schiedti]|nr:hypothetical protein Pelo_6833 [Pelomyxa schiedti]